VGLGVLALGRLIPPAWYLQAIGPRRPDRIALSYFGQETSVSIVTHRFTYTPSEANARLVWTYDPDATFNLVAWEKELNIALA
jgi:hypothetical protein